MSITRRRWGRTILAAAFVLLAAASLRVCWWRPFALSGEAPGDGLWRVAGVVHVHTTLSDGGGTPAEVIAAARQAGLGFLSITDHNVLDAKPREGYHDGLLVLVGSEISTPSGHVLGLGLERDPVWRFNGDALDALEDVRDLGGVAFAAHPFSGRNDLGWSGWELPGPWGIELMNGDSEWRRAGPRLLLSLGLYPLNQRYALLSGLTPSSRSLDRWDRMLSRRAVVGIAGADAHSRLRLGKRIALRFPSYESLFDLCRVHLLLSGPLQGRLEADRPAVLDAVRRGRLYIGLDALAPADAFGFSVVSAAGERWTMGDVLPPQMNARIEAGGRVPEGTRLVLLRDGAVFRESLERLELPLPSGRGIYRVEAYVPGWAVPWIVTNPITVAGQDEQERRAAAAAWPASPSPRPHRSFSAMPGGAGFAAEHDPTSWMDPAVVSTGAGPGGIDALQMAFRLAAPTPGQPFTWCALVDRQRRDLSGHAGLRFWIRGDGEYRLWVQVRDENPRSADDGLEWWLASARTSRDWREVLLPFSRFRTINSRTDGRLDADRAQAIVFVLDHATVKVGTEGRIWIADPGVYD